MVTVLASDGNGKPPRKYNYYPNYTVVKVSIITNC